MINVIYPTNIKKYHGCVFYRKDNDKWIVQIKTPTYSKSFNMKKEAEEHLIYKNFELNLPIKNIIYDHGDGIVAMELLHGKMTLCDYKDLEILHKHIWHISHGYVCGFLDGNMKQLHNQIMCFTPTNKMSVDHSNRNTLDNTKSNLRIATRLEQCLNQTIRSDNKSGYKGVFYDKRNRLWSAKWSVNGIRKSKSFSIKKYGDKAKEMAVNLRKEMAEKHYQI